MRARYGNRTEAGRRLGSLLTAYSGRDGVVVLGLPRGGVPVAFEVATMLDAPLDVFIVRKLGVPGHEELAMGALAMGGIRVLNDDVVGRLRIPPSRIDAVAASEQAVLDSRVSAYRGDRPLPAIEGKTVIVVDDGLATGASMRAAVVALRRQDPAAIVVAVPIAAAETCAELRELAGEVVCALTPSPFFAVGMGYDDFSQVTDEEVRRLLTAAWARDTDGGNGAGSAA